MADKNPNLVGKATRKKDSGSITKAFFVETFDAVRSYVWKEVLVPGIKSVFIDMVNNGLSMLLYGSTGNVVINGGTQKSSSIYHQAWQQQQQKQKEAYHVKRQYSYDPLVLSTESDGYALLEDMQDILNKKGKVTVADMYDIVGDTRDWTDAEHGWRSLRGSSITPTRGGWLVKLPPTEEM